ncbi:MAG TPA: dihydroorotate dehydrogenase electron transfer subunit [Coriobacteriia bacterium]|nr:dihydroorotate dehydrogenase electron transfer subunit [Coriobacteriia bacterium]
MCDGGQSAVTSAATASRPILEKGRVIDNVALGSGMGFITLEAPRVASMLLPGQFVHLRVGEPCGEHILRRPLSVCDFDADAGLFKIYYQIKGGGTAALSARGKGEELDFIGPIGRPWTPPEGCTRALLVGGGVGCAPLTPLYKALLEAGVEVQMIRGAQNATMMAALEVLDFTNTGCKMILTTDDGSVGYHGFVTVPARECLQSGGYDYVATCGPEPMQKLIAGMAAEAGVYCEVSLERRMACGIGACLSCVVDTTDGKKRACVDGPVFDASVIVW